MFDNLGMLEVLAENTLTNWSPFVIQFIYSYSHIV